MNTTKTLINTMSLVNTENAIKSAKTLIKTAEKSAFRIAVNCAYASGVSIVGATLNDNPISQGAVAEAVDKGRTTVCRWIGAVEIVNKYQQFDNFNNGVYPFSFDKLFLYDSIIESGTDLDFDKAMSMTVKELSKLKKKDSKDSDGDGEKAIILYDGTMYEVDLAGLEKLLDSADIIEKEDIEK